MLIIPFKPETPYELDICDNDPEDGKRHGRATYKIKYNSAVVESTYLCINCLRELQETLAEVLDGR